MLGSKWAVYGKMPLHIACMHADSVCCRLSNCCCVLVVLVASGTIVYEGVLDGRPVAVKRLLRQFYSMARKEIQVLIVSDEHPNVVRCFAMEEDREFVYLALEKCKQTLSGRAGVRSGCHVCE